eukprot:CAMPEP_0119561186 /NCGR_PEP_ID=MMETSP1352-20130426/16935_1 /TAXON_ID=265584 /ORGANISM="Stauroneis constricta, Strain CCMP1120" /LENGTH=292 /DNA_ID=CAMNT_0007609343 /DNA_START=54 /DNA_END=932 /DNA_ORIENTATION=-
MLNILVTGASDGIGLALCKLLVKEHKARVYLCARNPTKGAAAVEAVKEYCKETTDGGGGSSNDVLVHLVIMDVSTDGSVQAAAAKLREEQVKLDVIVNNAGIGLSERIQPQDVINVNYHGPKRVVKYLLPLLNTSSSSCCRIVNVGSGAGPMFVGKQESEKQKRMCNPDISLEDLEQLEAEGWANDGYKGYGLSKALLASYTVYLSRQHDSSKVAVFCLTPGFVDTNMTKGRGASLTPFEGTKSTRHCIFDARPNESGWYFGSDSKRSPLHVLRSPGEPVFDGVYPWDNSNK